MPAAVRVGLTGGIGSGKTTVGEMLAVLGAAVIDSDAIARAVTAPGGAAIPLIAQAFGPEFITPAGALDRDRMRALAYADPAAKARLEGIVHPLVGAQTEAQAAAALAAGRRALVFDVPLLIETGRWRQKVDLLLVVDCSEETRIERVMRRSSLPRETIVNIIAAQATREQRLAAADIVICNDGIPLDALRREVALAARRFGL
ncbi:MAG: dephospho-CoA kinase [Burkholderiaceae bacterium]